MAIPLAKSLCSLKPAIAAARMGADSRAILSDRPEILLPVCSMLFAVRFCMRSCSVSLSDRPLTDCFAAAIWVFMAPRLALTLRTVGVNKSRSRMAASMTLLAMLFHLHSQRMDSAAFQAARIVYNKRKQTIRRKDDGYEA